MRNIIPAALFLLILTALSSCSNSLAVILPERSDLEFVDDRNAASPEFSQGWRDGCEVGESGGGNTFYKLFYRNNAMDGYKMAYSSDYKTAWTNAMWYCYRRDFVKQKSSIWGSTFKGFI